MPFSGGFRGSNITIKREHTLFKVLNIRKKETEFLLLKHPKCVCGVFLR